jgi:hypothetical protein
VIGLPRRSEIELVDWNAAAMLVLNIERAPGQDVVVNLLGRAAVLEHNRDRFLDRRGRCRTRKLSGGLVGVARRRLILLLRRRIISPARNCIALCGGRRARAAVALVSGIPVSGIAGAYPTAPRRKSVGKTRAVRRNIGPAMVIAISMISPTAIPMVGGVAGASSRVAPAPEAMSHAWLDADGSAAGESRGPCESMRSGGSGSGGGGSPVEGLSSAAREASPRSSPLGESGKHQTCDDQRDRSETLHGDILRLF